MRKRLTDKVIGRAFKRKNKGNKFKKIIIIFFASILLISLLFFFSSKFFTIKKIDIKTENIFCASIDELKSSLNFSGENLIFASFTKVKSELFKKFLCIKDIKISRSIPDKINLLFLGREPVAILVSLKSKEATSSAIIEKFSQLDASDSADASSSALFNPSLEETADTYLVDESGVIFAKNLDWSNVPRLVLYGENLILGLKINQEIIKNALAIFDGLKTFGVKLSDAKIYSESLLLVNTRNNELRIIFSLIEKIDIQLASLQLILNKAKIDKENIEFIDLRFDKPIVKFAPKNHG